MKLASIIVSEIQSDFEGGNSLSVSWNTVLTRAVRKVLSKTRPKTLVRSIPIFGGLTGSLVYYYSPADVLVPTAIYGNDGRPLFAYRTPKAFNDKEWEQDVFTIETVNNVQMIKVRRELASGALVVEECDAVGTITGTVTPTVNDFRYLTGSGALEATFDDSGKYYGDTFDEVQDISDYTQGLGIIPFYCEAVHKIASVQLQLRIDNDNYITLNSTTDSIGENFRNGWNFARFAMASRVTTGTVDLTQIASWRLIITAESGQTVDVIVDRITLQLAKAFYFEYISKYPFIDSDGITWQNTIDYQADYVNFNDDDLLDALHYEACLIVDQGTTKRSSKTNTAQTLLFKTELANAYQSYFIRFPSQEEPLSYNISPEIQLHPDDVLPVPKTYNMDGDEITEL